MIKLTQLNIKTDYCWLLFFITDISWLCQPWTRLQRYTFFRNNASSTYLGNEVVLCDFDYCRLLLIYFKVTINTMYVICKKRTCTHHSIISRQFSIPTGRQTELFIDIWYHVANALKNQFPDGLANGIIKQMALTNIGRSRVLRFISV